MKIPTAVLRETLSVEAFEGSSAYGPVYSDPETVKARVEGKRRLVRSTSGTDLISSATAYVRPEVDKPIGSRVTHGDRVYELVDVLPGEGLTGPALFEWLLA